MKKLFVVPLSVAFAVLSLSAAQAGNVENGKKLFESPTFGGGTSGKTCASCHADGTKLGADLFEREKHMIMGKEVASVADTVNVCIEMAMKGKAIKTDSDEMKDVLAYMQTLVKEEKE
ncbi:MAG: DUF1924 domain-containing protein [Candidatus Electrothrix sp. LOE2]|nr:DUF1924 domain-containing protein [Candidatus Electrothrix sp. LOE2]